MVVAARGPDARYWPSLHPNTPTHPPDPAPQEPVRRLGLGAGRGATSAPTLDAHQHFWQYDPAHQDWMTDAVDLDGRIRIRYGRVDMGCYERIYGGSIYSMY